MNGDTQIHSKLHLQQKNNVLNGSESTFLSNLPFRLFIYFKELYEFLSSNSTKQNVLNGSEFTYL